MTTAEFLNLKKNDIINVNFDSCIRRDTTVKLLVPGKPRALKNGKLFRIGLKNTNNLNGVKYWLYLRNENIFLAIGDLAATIKTIEIIKN